MSIGQLGLLSQKVNLAWFILALPQKISSAWLISMSNHNRSPWPRLFLSFLHQVLVVKFHLAYSYVGSQIGQLGQAYPCVIESQPEGSAVSVGFRSAVGQYQLSHFLVAWLCCHQFHRHSFGEG